MCFLSIVTVIFEKHVTITSNCNASESLKYELELEISSGDCNLQFKTVLIQIIILKVT